MANMFDISMAVLNCAEYNPKKIKEYWGEAKSALEARKRELEFGIWISIHILLCSEKYHRSKPTDKQGSMKLRKKLVKLLEKDSSRKTKKEHVNELVNGLEKAIAYLSKIKSFMSSIALQEVEKYLKKLLEENK